MVSDAYYWDSSSVVQLCREREMPMMVQNVKRFMKKEEDERRNGNEKSL